MCHLELSGTCVDGYEGSPEVSVRNEKGVILVYSPFVTVDVEVSLQICVTVDCIRCALSVGIALFTILFIDYSVNPNVSRVAKCHLWKIYGVIASP